MKRMIIYDTDKGFTKKCAELLWDNMKDAILTPLDLKNLSIEGYDEIYIGTYIIRGEINKTTQKFLKMHYNSLLDKKLKLFISALDKADYNHALQTSLHPEIFYRADIINCGGRLKYDELTLFEKRSVRKFLNTEEDVEILHKERLLDLIQK